MKTIIEYNFILLILFDQLTKISGSVRITQRLKQRIRKPCRELKPMQRNAGSIGTWEWWAPTQGTTQGNAGNVGTWWWTDNIEKDDSRGM